MWLSHNMQQRKQKPQPARYGPRGKSENMNTWATDRTVTRGFKGGREKERNIYRVFHDFRA
jgi:hypothetical protein